ncbi:Fumarate reductase flavoprotein subunit [Corynebacterium accolens]|nr:Fumarate reductase flavoprotein subunit [Corynebacterium accolens]
MMRAYDKGAYLASPAFVQFHPTGLPVNSDWQSKTILMSESLRNDGRIWSPEEGDDRDPNTIPEEERDYLERRYPAFGNLVPRDVASRAISQQINNLGVGPLKNSVYLDFRDAIERLGKDKIRERSNLIQMYEEAIGESAYETPMRIAPTCHFTMGGLWTDFNEMTSIDGLFAAGECSWTYHGANRLGANSCFRLLLTAGSPCRLPSRTTWLTTSTRTSWPRTPLRQRAAVQKFTAHAARSVPLPPPAG